MRFFAKKMLENGHSNLQTKLWVHITSNIFKIIHFKNHGIAPTPPDLPILKAYPTPGVGGRFGICSLKWRERMNLKVPGAILPLGCAILSTRAKTLRGVVATPGPLGELGLSWANTVYCNCKVSQRNYEWDTKVLFQIWKAHIFYCLLELYGETFKWFKTKYRLTLNLQSCGSWYG